MGGGFGISYQKDRKIKLNSYAKLVSNLKKFNCNIIFEPGRSIIGNTGTLISKVQYIKKGRNKSFIILDAGMNDFMRPALYDAFHNIIPVIKTSKKIKGPVEFVGPICETTCKFGRYKNYQKLPKKLCCHKQCWCYGFVLSSNYNTRPLIAEIFVNKTNTKK